MLLSAQDETRTHTILRPLPPQSSVYTNFTTCALALTLAWLRVWRLYNTPCHATLSGLQTYVLHPEFRKLKIDSSSKSVVPRTGLEPAHLAACAPETHASTNSAIWARLHQYFSCLAASRSITSTYCATLFRSAKLRFTSRGCFGPSFA